MCKVSDLFPYTPALYTPSNSAALRKDGDSTGEASPMLFRFRRHSTPHTGKPLQRSIWRMHQNHQPKKKSIGDA